jgi:hypothetical protein
MFPAKRHCRSPTRQSSRQSLKRGFDRLDVKALLQARLVESWRDRLLLGGGEQGPGTRSARIGPLGDRSTGASWIIADATPKKYRLWRVGRENEFVAVVAEANTFEEWKAISPRPEWHYQANPERSANRREIRLPPSQVARQDLTAKERAPTQGPGRRLGISKMLVRRHNAT